MKKSTLGMFLLLSLIIFKLLEIPALGRQLNLSLNYNGYYNDNIFLNASNVKDYISEIQTGLNITLKKLNLFLTASAELYTDNPGYNSIYIEPGIEFIHPLKGQNNFYLGISYILLSYKDIYTDFNYNGPLLQTGIKIYTSPRTLLKAGVRFQSKKFSNYTSFDFSDYSALLELRSLLNTQTTLRLETGFNYRFYPHIQDGYDFGEDYNYFHNQASHGKGKGGSGSPHNQQNNWFTYHRMSIPTMYGMAAIDLGLSTRIGITGEAEYRMHFTDMDNTDAETLIKNAYILYPQNDLYLWKGVRLTMQMKMVLFRQASISLIGKISYYDKQYPGIYVMDSDGNPIEPLLERKDSLLLYMLQAVKKIGKLEFQTEISYRHNKSNDDYFFYNLLTITVGIGYYL